MKKYFPFILFSGTPRGVQEYGSGSGTFIVPTGVTSICVLCIGGGAGTSSTVNTNGSGSTGGSAGSLCYKNDIAVTPGASYSYSVGSGGGPGSSGTASTFSGSGVSLSAGGGVLGGRGGAVTGGDVNSFGSVASYNNVSGVSVYLGSGGKNSLTSSTLTASVAASGGGRNGSTYISGVLYDSYQSNPGTGYYGYVGNGGFISNHAPTQTPQTDSGNGGVVRIMWGAGLSYPSNITP